MQLIRMVVQLVVLYQNEVFMGRIGQYECITNNYCYS
jgi:hypothetical protein